jgi:hypothetical protein
VTFASTLCYGVVGLMSLQNASETRRIQQEERCGYENRTRDILKPGVRVSVEYLQERGKPPDSASIVRAYEEEFHKRAGRWACPIVELRVGSTRKLAHYAGVNVTVCECPESVVERLVTVCRFLSVVRSACEMDNVCVCVAMPRISSAAMAVPAVISTPVITATCP